MLKIRVAFLVGLMLVGATGTHAKPLCPNKLKCGHTCDFDANVGGGGGGLCNPGGLGSGDYCWQEAVMNDGDSLVISCQYGTYDQCCDPEIDPY